MTARVFVGVGEFVGAGVLVREGVAVLAGVFVGPIKDWVGASVATGGWLGAGAWVGAAPPQEDRSKDRIKIKITLRIIRTHFRIHAGQQAGSELRERISPEAMSAVCTSILPSRTVLNARVFPSGDQCGVSARRLLKKVTCSSSPLCTFTR